MNTEIRYYKETITEIFNKIEKEEESIIKASKIMAEIIMNDGLIHVMGTGGHSSMAAEELTFRAGGLVPINPILDAGISLIHGAARSCIIERTPGYGIKVMDAYGIGEKEGEVIIIANAYGINTLTIDIALESKKRKLKTIGVTSKSFAQAIPKNHPSRHPSGRNLFEIVDIFIDCHLPLGDAVVDIEGSEQKVAPVSTFCNTFVLHCLEIETVKRLVEKGKMPPVWKSANMPGGDEYNKKYQMQYFSRVKHLR